MCVVACKLFHRSLPFIVAALGLAACVIAYYPGLLEPDSLDQFAQAQTGHFDDWHPPIMALLWRALNQIHNGPQPLFMVHLALFWLALALLARALMVLDVRGAALAPAVGFAPWLFPLLGVLISDVAVAGAWLFVTALLFHQVVRQKPLNGALLAVAGLAFGYGALARANTIFAAAPLIYYACSELAPTRPRLRLIAAVLTPLVLLALSASLNGATASSDYPMGSLQVFDIGGISHRVGRNLLPGVWSAADSNTFVRCYQPDAWDVYQTPTCASTADKLAAADLWSASGLTGPWLGAIMHHPVAYAAHRLDYANHFFRWLGPIAPGDIDYDTEDTAPAAYAHADNAIYNFYSALAETNYIALRPYFWLALCISAWMLSMLAIPSTARRFASALSASGGIYLLFYVFVGVASDFRYALWPICAALAAMGALLACHWRPRRLATGAIVCLALIGLLVGVSELSAIGHSQG